MLTMKRICFIIVTMLLFPLNVFSENQYEYPDIFALESGNQWIYSKNMNGVTSEGLVFTHASIEASSGGYSLSVLRNESEAITLTISDLIKSAMLKSFCWLINNFLIVISQ